VPPRGTARGGGRSTGARPGACGSTGWRAGLDGCRALGCLAGKSGGTAVLLRVCAACGPEGRLGVLGWGGKEGGRMVKKGVGGVWNRAGGRQ
jgi:hypothetical protein